jgi:serine O-acetyltransferase
MRNRAYIEELYREHQTRINCPSPQEISNAFNHLLEILFPDLSQDGYLSLEDFENHIQKMLIDWEQMIRNTEGNGNLNIKSIVDKFFNSIPEIHNQLKDDVEAMYQGDPAAKTSGEVIRTYPGFYAISAYRIAHALSLLGVSGIPRIITEHAHGKTGIDIHPGAKIGRHFCIDHGTGVVIGETTIVGDHVKVYQGVTLGALSVDKMDAEKKRHPTIEDNVVIYAGATILGGETVIGHDSIIGGNVWITHSIPPNSKLYYQSKMHHSEHDDSDVIVIKSDRN